jgi:hypothetical protein
MKRFLLLVFLLATVGGSLSAQHSIPDKDVLLRARIIPLHGQTAAGYLYSLGDTSLLLSRERRFLRLSDSIVAAGTRFRYVDLSTVVLYKKGVIGRSALIGFCIGAGVGALIGLASGDDDPGKTWFAYTAGEKALGGGILVGGAGAIVGLIVGAAAHKTFYIHGKREKYEKMRARMIAKLGL